jgi:hypothetical protein
MMGNRKFLVFIICAFSLIRFDSALASSDAKVFPVKGFFYDAGSQTKLAPGFLKAVNQLGVNELSGGVHSSLNKAFNGKTALLTQASANRTYAVSFHVTRAVGYKVDKGNGNSDLVTSVTASVYFTNVLNGEIFTTVSQTNTGRAVVSNTENADSGFEALFTSNIKSLINSLAEEAGKTFSPILVEAKITDQVGNLMVLDSGYGKGIQVGDSLEDDSGQLIDIVYSAKSYSIAQRILADKATPGSVFHKYMSHKADGKSKPRTLVVADEIPEGYSRQYIEQLFSELVGSKAPLSIIQINPGFSAMIKSVLADNTVQLSITDASKRRIPELFIRLRIPEPIMYEVRTNLNDQTIRNYKEVAFAELVDTTKRVNFSAIGKDKISDAITKGVGPNFSERREVLIKNTLVDLANGLARIGDPVRDQVTVEMSSSKESTISSVGKAFFADQKGMILHKIKAHIGDSETDIYFPVSEAAIGSSNGQRISLTLGLPIGSVQSDPVSGDIYEIERLGTSPGSSNYFMMCTNSENLGTLKTTTLMHLSSAVVGSKMPGVFYAPSISDSVARTMGTGADFSGEIRWRSPQVNYCIQPVDRITVESEKCDIQCQKSIFAKYTMRVKSGDQVISKVGAEERFSTTGFYPQTPPDQSNKLVEADILDEAEKLIGKTVEAINFSSK